MRRAVRAFAVWLLSLVGEHVPSVENLLADLDRQFEFERMMVESERRRRRHYEALVKQLTEELKPLRAMSAEFERWKKDRDRIASAMPRDLAESAWAGRKDGG